MIILENQKPIGRGSHREVYVHPDKPDRCLKVMIEDWKKSGRRQRATWLSRTFRSKRTFHENLSEFHFSKTQHRRVGDLAGNYFALSYDMVETDQGEALEVQLIQDYDGQISLSMKAYLLKFGLTEELKEAIEYFWDGVMKYGIFLQGRPDNVSIRQLKNKKCQLIAIDGFGLPQVVPFAKWLKSSRLKFLSKRRTKQDKAIRRILEAKKAGIDQGSKGMRLD